MPVRTNSYKTLTVKTSKMLLFWGTMLWIKKLEPKITFTIFFFNLLEILAIDIFLIPDTDFEKPVSGTSLCISMR